mmetsp:Transcript_32787/g.97727  ORF Transcript_32787/g.97727 Transcript_32787/m.97727 type:complete len:233 (-) Transcript_32787:1665-2363(-)
MYHAQASPRHEVLALKHQRALWHLLHRQQHACAASVRRTCVAVVTLDVLTAARARGAVLRLPHPVGPVEAQLGAAAAADRAVAAEQAARRRVVARRRDRPPLVLRVGATAHVVPKKLLHVHQVNDARDRRTRRALAAIKRALWVHRLVTRGAVHHHAWPLPIWLDANVVDVHGRLERHYVPRLAAVDAEAHLIGRLAAPTRMPCHHNGGPKVCVLVDPGALRSVAPAHPAVG